MNDVTTSDELDHAMRAPLTLLFKHSPRCAISLDALEEMLAHLGARKDGLLAVLDVVRHPALSLDLATRTGIRHESPQAILVKDGRILWHASHHGITPAALERELARTS